MSQYRRLVSAMTAMHHRLEDCETLLDKAVRVIVAQGRTIEDLEDSVYDEGEEGDEGEEDEELEEEYDEGDEGDEDEEEPRTQAQHEADFNTGPAEAEDPEERARMNAISTGKSSGRTQAEIAAMMGGGGIPQGAAPDVPEGSQGPTGFERMIAQAQEADEAAAASEPAEEAG